jgi:hypothetical protein
MTRHRFSLTIVIALSLVSVCRAASDTVQPGCIQVSDAARFTLSPESVVLELYAALSFPPGKALDRGRVRLLFTPEARILFAGGPDGSPRRRTSSVDSFLDFATPAGEAASREEKELWRRAERFGNIAHIFSAYELRITSATGKPIVRRGVNSVQLYLDGSAWRIVSLIWDVESPGNPLPTLSIRGTQN